MQAAILPALREDLVLAPGPSERDGAPGWVLFDPIRNRYFALEGAAIALLRHWHLGEKGRVLAAAGAGGRYAASEGELLALLRFLAQNELLDAVDPGQRAFLAKAARDARSSLAQRVQLLLFLRIPILRPARFLAATWPYVSFLATRGAALAILVMGLVGLFLVGRDWDRFVADAASLASPRGLLLFFVALAVIKVLHEFGHAYAARRYGLRVSSMGVAILIFMPVLYTDVSDAWRLTSHRARLAIGAAGIAVELALACIATFLWSFLAPGLLRDVVFLVAGTTWILTLFVNLNPLMRFDGYFLLSDALRVPNLQSRAFALGRWRLREALFGFRDDPPERLPDGLRRILYAWCFAAWIWRVAIVVAIAVAVYFVLPKALALPLIAFEIVWLVLRPLFSELKEWWARRADMRLNGAMMRSLALLAALLLLLTLPWPLGVEMPARLEASRASAVFAAAPGRLDAMLVAEGQRVEEGEALFALTSPDIVHELEQTRRSIAIAQTTLMREAAMPDSAVRAGVSQERLAQDLATWRGLADQARRLTGRAGHAGVVRDVARGLEPGIWLSPDRPLFRIVEGPARLTAYVDAADLARIDVGMRGRFLPDDPAGRARDVEIVAVAPVAEAELEVAAFASIHGGPIAAGTDASGRLVPSRAIWRVTLAPVEEEAAPERAAAGTVRVSVSGEAPIARLLRSVAAIVIRESWF